MKKLIIFLAYALLPTLSLAQLPAHLQDKMEYPVLNFDPWVGVVNTKAKALKYDKKLNYKVVIDITDTPGDSSKIMRTLREVGRTFNLNMANGVPQRKLSMAVVIHGGAINGILNNEAYQKKYGILNPNLEAIAQMKKEGIEFYVCAQILAFRRVPEEDITKDVELALSAKTALVSLDQMGYTYMKINEN